MRFLTKLFWLLPLSSLSVFASGSSPSINWWSLGSAYKDAPAIGWLLITFILFVYGCLKVIKKPLGLYLETRSKDIRRQIEEGQRAKELSEERLRAYDEKLKTLSSEIGSLKAEFHAQAIAEKKERAQIAQALEERILKDADDTIKANFGRMKQKLAEEAVDQALVLAKETIASKNRDQVDEILKHSFMSDLKLAAKEVH